MSKKNTKSSQPILFILGIIFVILLLGYILFQRIILPKFINNTVNKSVEMAMNRLSSTDFSKAQTTPFSYPIGQAGGYISLNSNIGIVDLDANGPSETLSGEMKFFTTEPHINVENVKDEATKQDGTLFTFKSSNEQPDKYLLHFSSQIASGLQVTMGAGILNLDLTNGLIKFVNTNIGSGKINLTLSNKTSSKVNLTTGTGSIELHVPSTVGKNITFNQGVPANLKLGSDFTRTKNGFKSANYDNAQYKADININQAMGGFTLNSIE